MKSVTATLLAMLLLPMKSPANEPAVYLNCGSTKTSHRMIVTKQGSFGFVQIFKQGEDEPVVSAPASFSFPRCGQGDDCHQSPRLIKTVGTNPAYTLSLPWRAMESGDSFHGVLTTKTKGGPFGAPTAQKINLPCDPGQPAQELIASTRVSK